MANDVLLSARSVASLLAQIIGPSIYDAPPFGGGNPSDQSLADPIRGPFPEPWRWVLLNPQPLPPREGYALALADARIREILTLDRLATLAGAENAGRAQERAFRLVAEIDELCPRWPRWPKVWPPPPRPPVGWGDEMAGPALFLFGSRILAAAEYAEQERLQDALTALGEKALGLSVRR